MLKKSSLPIVILLFLLTAAAYAADWPFFRGPAGTGISPEKGINKNWKAKTPKPIWKINMQDDGFAGPSVVGNIMLIIDHRDSQDSLRAININTGKGIWQFKYAESGGSNYGFSRSTPVVSAGKVYVVSRSGKMFCLALSSGKKIWSLDIMKDFNGNRPGWDYAWSPLIDGKKVIVQPGGQNAAVAALNADTGATIWQGGGSDKSGYATAVKATIQGKSQYVVFTGYSLIGVDANSGKLLWSIKWKTTYDVNAATPIVLGNSVFITSGYGSGCAKVNIDSGGKASFAWKNKEMQSQFSTPVAQGGYIYGTTDPGDLICLDFATGKTKWRKSGFEKGGICGVDGTIIAANGATGEVVMAAMSPSGYRELGRIKPLGGQSWTAPIVAGGKLFVRNKSALVCLSLK